MKKQNNIKMPPNSTSLEEAVLGALMMERDTFHEVAGLITSDSFYDERHQKVFKAISVLIKNNKPVDIITVSQQMRQDGTLEDVGGGFFVTTLTSKVASGANISTHAAIIQQHYLSRETIKIAADLHEKAFNGLNDIFDLHDETITKIQSLTESDAGQVSDIGSLITGQLKEYENASNGSLTGVSSGFENIDQLTSGWQKSNLIIIAARPAMGKTALALNIARNAAIEANAPVAVFSLEMSKQQLTDRLISSETGIYLDKIIKRTLTPTDFEILHGMNDLISSNIFIDDTAGLSIQSLRSKCAKLKRKHDIKLIIVDYLQLMKGEGDKWSREQEISSISRGLKGIAKNLDIPVIALSQLSRKVEERPGHAKRPILSDLRESGSIEQDADQVIFLFRPEYYGIMEDESGQSCIGMTEIIFAKNRQGATDNLLLSFNGSKMKFTELLQNTTPF